MVIKKLTTAHLPFKQKKISGLFGKIPVFGLPYLVSGSSSLGKNHQHRNPILIFQQSTFCISFVGPGRERP